MNYYKNHFLLTFLIICLLCTYFTAASQCDCQESQYENYCYNEGAIEYPSGTNITYQLENAIYDNCKIRLVNPTGITHVYYTFPQVFRNISHKEIILDAGVHLLGIPGGFSDCSQSVLTFDGNDVHDIFIRGNYCEGQEKPLIGMVEADYTHFDDQGYLVGADNSGNPYLDNNGQPNYVFSDFDADPYFDNNGDPNFIGNGNQPKVQKDCEYNDLLCNRKVVVWCPFSWEARHIIALHGVENFWIHNLVIANASGGDGIQVTDDRDFNVSSEIHLNNLDFTQNARNGLKITNAYCVELDQLDFYKNGTLAPIDFVTPQAAFNLDQNTSPGSVDDYMGTLPDYTLYNITFEIGYFFGNINRDLSFDIPLDLTLCEQKAGFKAKNICISHSDDAIYFERSNALQTGDIKLHVVSADEFDNALVVENSWLSSNIGLSLKNWTVNKTGLPANAFNINSTTFCPSATVSDICKSSNILDDLCLPVSCVTPSYSCVPNQDPICQGNECDLDIYTSVEEVIDYNCECDYLFMVDESGSVSGSEWEEMNCSIDNMMNELDSICMDSCDTRFALIQWAWANSQNLASNFDCLPFEFERAFSGGTDVGAAVEFLLKLLSNEILQPNKECFKVLIFTDANCMWSNWEGAGTYADIIKTLFPNIEFIVIDYTSNGQLEECEGVLNVIDDGEGEADPDNIIQSEFDCETGIGIEDISDTSYVYTIHVEVDPQCQYPTINWTAYSGGEILSTSPDGATIVVNGEGYYLVEVECAFGCPGGMTGFAEFDADFFQNRIVQQTAIIKKDRTRYYNGNAYTPHEFEQLMIRKAEALPEEIQISPNPFADVLHIQIPQKGIDYNLTILNTQGQLVYNATVSSDNEIQVDLNRLTDGLYVVKLFNTATMESVSHKILKLAKE